MTPFEEEEKKVYLTDVINREMKTNATREKLEIKYQAAVKAKESEVKKINLISKWVLPISWSLFFPYTARYHRL